ncbi:acyl carrier protein [Selenomonas sp. KH1T6]|uniref:acyl carrier protein n=1 Tax=Selenomonas sp. KH1T6 TaxID=3158784 RepID=UPI0008A76BBC|nr:Phosphopantetheine attachment site [Selenomonas ruminantium]
MTMNENFKKILDQVNPEILEVEDVDLMEEGIIDSFIVMQIVAMVEKEFKIDFDPEDIVEENFSSPYKMWETIQKYGSKE